VNIDVVLSTYNGATYLREQLDSICREPCELTINIRDDGSSDDTIDVVEEEYIRAGGSNVSLVRGCNVGVKRSFSQLLEKSSGDYVFLSDQDDVWIPGRSKLMIDALVELEREAGGQSVPCLVFTDAKVVDSNLSELCESFWRWEGLNPSTGIRLNRLFLQNVAPGCTMLVNRALLDAALPVPEQALMHDWWLMLVATVFGRVSYVSEATVLYRQHSKNTVGAHRHGMASMVAKRHTARAKLKMVLNQVLAFRERYGLNIPAHNRMLVDEFLHMFEVGFFGRRIIMLRYGFIKSTLLKNFALVITL
jgi:glycosyltransferase involved in cell wall biosynthesis